MAELLPELSCILFKDAGQTLTAKQQQRPTITQTRTTKKVFKPLTIVELRTAAIALKVQSPKTNPQPNTATKPNWNSTGKLQKTKSPIARGQFRHKSVRKVLNFQPKCKPATNVRATLISSETPIFPKPELKAKKSLLDKSMIRISGICNIPPTPIAQNKITKHQISFQHNNKEHKLYQANTNRNTIATPKYLITKKFKQTCQDTPPSNVSFQSNGDASVLLKEQEINDIEERSGALGEESTLENIAEIASPVSIPLKEYRNVKKKINNTSDTEISYNDNTIMPFDKVSLTKEVDVRVRSVIVSLCDMLNKGAVTDTNKTNTKLTDLLEVEKQTQRNIQMIEYGIETLNNIKESQLKSLQSLRKKKNKKKKIKW